MRSGPTGSGELVGRGGGWMACTLTEPFKVVGVRPEVGLTGLLWNGDGLLGNR